MLGALAGNLSPGGRRVVAGDHQLLGQAQPSQHLPHVVLEVLLAADEVGPSLRFATAKVNKMSRSTGNGAHDDEWATATPARPTATKATAEDPFATGGAASDDEPPF